MAPPVFNMVAGPNGSGKTTLTDALRRLGVELGHYVNADEIASNLKRGTVNARAKLAQTMALERLEELLARRDSVTFETVMSHESKIELLRRAKALSYDVALYYVGTEDPIINLTRVMARVAQGGHDVPVDKIRARYFRTMGHLAAAALAADRGVVFDNSVPTEAFAADARPLQTIGSFINGEDGFVWTQRGTRRPEWIDRYLLRPIVGNGR